MIFVNNLLLCLFSSRKMSLCYCSKCIMDCVCLSASDRLIRYVFPARNSTKIDKIGPLSNVSTLSFKDLDNMVVLNVSTMCLF